VASSFSLEASAISRSWAERHPSFMPTGPVLCFSRRLSRRSEATDLDACAVRRHDSAVRVDAQTHVGSEIAWLRASIGRAAAAVDGTLNDHRFASDDGYPRWGGVEHRELSRQLNALHEHVARAPSRSQDQLDLRAEFATLLCFAKALQTDAEAWRAAFRDGLKELEREEAAAREDRERLAAESALCDGETRCSRRLMKRPDGSRKRAAAIFAERCLSSGLVKLSLSVQ
jgi:hypothetical protein